MSDNIFYVYQYVNPNGTPYYIGKGKDSRINDLHNNVVVPDKQYRQIVKEYMSESDALAYENQLIRYYGRKLDGGILDNIKINQWAGTCGWKHSVDTKNKISKANTGKVRSDIHKKNYSKPKTPEHAQKIREANLGRIDPERNLKISESMKGKPWSDARRAAHNNKQTQGIS